MADGNGEGLVVRMKEPNRKDPDEMFDWVVERLQREGYPTEEMTIKQIMSYYSGPCCLAIVSSQLFRQCQGRLQ